MRHADAVVIGEGECAWPAVIRDLRRGDLAAVYDARGQSFDLRDAPMPAFHLLEVDRYNRITVQTQRGCPWRCDFCAASMRISPTYKVKPVEKVIAEIQRIKDFWATPFIEFADDNSFVRRPHSKRLLLSLAQENVRWFTESDIGIADDEELLDLMAASGCAQVLIGLESPSLSGLDGLEQRTNWKAKQLDRYARAVRRIQDRGITVNGCFVLGLDGTGPGSFDDVFDFVQESGLFEVQITVLTAFPGTPLYQRMKRDGRILREEAWELCTLFDVNFQPEQMSVRELELGFRDLAARLYNTLATRERRERYLRRRHDLLRRPRERQLAR